MGILRRIWHFCIDSFIGRVLKAIFSGYVTLVNLSWSLFGLFGTVAFALGCSRLGGIDGGIHYFTEQFTRFFSENQMDPILNALGGLFTKYTEVLSRYPEAHLAIMALGLILIPAIPKCTKWFWQSIKRVFEEPQENSLKYAATNLQGKVIPNAASGYAMAKANRKIGFDQHDSEKDGDKVVDITGMPSVLARHANWGKKIK